MKFLETLTSNIPSIYYLVSYIIVYMYRIYHVEMINDHSLICIIIFMITKISLVACVLF